MSSNTDVQIPTSASAIRQLVMEIEQGVTRKQPQPENSARGIRTALQAAGWELKQTAVREILTRLEESSHIRREAIHSVTRIVYHSMVRNRSVLDLVKNHLLEHGVIPAGQRPEGSVTADEVQQQLNASSSVKIRRAYVQAMLNQKVREEGWTTGRWLEGGRYHRYFLPPVVKPANPKTASRQTRKQKK